MAGYLIAEEGLLIGTIFSFEEGSEWIIGRDPDEANLVLEDPKVSRKHAICRATEEGIVFENLSSTNPAIHNGNLVVEEIVLQEDDLLQIGQTQFRFTLTNPINLSSDKQEPVFEEVEDLSSIHLQHLKPPRWLLKVISGPNAGAEFNLQKSSSYTLGKDSESCDLVFNDLSVSREHARLQITDKEQLFIEDLKSRNGVLVNGSLIVGMQELTSQDLIALGTTSFLVIDREQIHETILSIQAKVEQPAFEPQEIVEEKPPVKTTSWKEMIIPYKHLAAVGVFGLFVLGLFVASLSLFKSEMIEMEKRKNGDIIREALLKFPAVESSFNESSGKLFLIGHVLSPIEYQELNYALSSFSFITSIENGVIIDELVWQNMNALLAAEPSWQAVSIHTPTAGRFVMKGYVDTIETATALSDYVNLNFPYLNLLENHVSIGNNLILQVQSVLLDRGFRNIVFNLSNGNLILSGQIDEKRSKEFSSTLKDLRGLPGIRSVKDFVIHSMSDGSLIDLSDQYQISGFSKGDNKQQFVIINAKVFGKGEILDGMVIQTIDPHFILLEKDGIKFKINYNLQ